jgi:hypothetical protein
MVRRVRRTGAEVQVERLVGATCFASAMNEIAWSVRQAVLGQVIAVT